MAYPPPIATPTPSPMPAQHGPGVVTCADYMDSCIALLLEEDQKEKVEIADIALEYQRIRDVMRAAES